MLPATISVRGSAPQAGDIVVVDAGGRIDSRADVIVGLDVIDRHAWTRVGHPTTPYVQVGQQRVLLQPGPALRAVLSGLPTAVPAPQRPISPVSEPLTR